MDGDRDSQIHVVILLVSFKCVNRCCRKVKGIICLNVQLSPDIPDKWDPGYFVEEDPALSLRDDADDGNAFCLVKVLGVCSDQDADLRSNFPVFLIICQYRVWYPGKLDRPAHSCMEHDGSSFLLF